MNAFPFIARKSFLRRRSHPITIPRSYVNYQQLEAEGLDRGPYFVIFPKGEQVSGRLRLGTNNWGPYYQLTVDVNGCEFPAYLNHEDSIFVLLTQIRGKNYAVLEYLE